MRTDGAFLSRAPVDVGRYVAGLDGPFSDGSFVVRTTDAGSGQVHYVRISASGKVLNNIAGPLYSAKVGPAPVWSPYGQNAVHGTSLYYSAGSKYEVQVYSNSGKPQQIIRLDRQPRPSTKSDIESFEREQSANRGMQKEKARVRKYSEYLPAVARLLTDADGNLWIGEGGSTAKVTHWLILDKERRFIGSLSTPSNMRLSDVGRDYVLGTCYDPEAGEWVCMYSIRH
jgi:hypothetical protein